MTDLEDYLRKFGQRGNAPGATREEIEAAFAEQARLDMKRVAHETRVRRAHIPALYADTTLLNWVAETAEQKRIATAAIRYVRGFREHQKSLVMMGGVGSGKTMLACAIGNELLEEGTQVEYTTVSAMHREVKATYQGAGKEGDVYHRLCSVPLLIIDELCAGKGTEAENAMLFEVVDIRYANRMPMIFVTNVDSDTLRAELGDRFVDRVKQIAHVFVMDWPSQRGRA
jgi:DNA replication protein DnaC